MILSYAKYKQFKSLVDAKENGKAVRNGLDFLRFVAEEYSRLEVYNNLRISRMMIAFWCVI